MSNISKIVKAKIENFSQENINKANFYCNQAAKLLKDFSNSQDINLVVQAMDLYNQSIQIYSRITEPYIALAYLSWQLNDHTNAIQLIKKALDIDPFNKSAQKLFSEIEIDFKNKSQSQILKKYSDKSLSTKINEKANKLSSNSSNDITSRISAIFNYKQEKATKKASKSSSNSINNNDDFDKMLKQTAKSMKKI